VQVIEEGSVHLSREAQTKSIEMKRDNHQCAAVNTKMQRIRLNALTTRHGTAGWQHFFLLEFHTTSSAVFVHPCVSMTANTYRSWQDCRTITTYFTFVGLTPRAHDRMDGFTQPTVFYPQLCSGIYRCLSTDNSWLNETVLQWSLGSPGSS